MNTMRIQIKKLSEVKKKMQVIKQEFNRYIEILKRNQIQILEKKAQ
jgi:hypothetical protein